MQRKMRGSSQMSLSAGRTARSLPPSGRPGHWKVGSNYNGNKWILSSFQCKMPFYSTVSALKGNPYQFMIIWQEFAAGKTKRTNVVHGLAAKSSRAAGPSLDWVDELLIQEAESGSRARPAGLAELNPNSQTWMPDAARTSVTSNQSW